MKPKVLSISKPKKFVNGIRLYAKVASRDFSNAIARDLALVGRPSRHHVVLIIRRGMRRWLCDCKSFLFVFAGRCRHCDHIKAVRQRVENKA